MPRRKARFSLLDSLPVSLLHALDGVNQYLAAKPAGKLLENVMRRYILKINLLDM